MSVFRVEDYWSVGEPDSTAAFHRALAACIAVGGGIVDGGAGNERMERERAVHGPIALPSHLPITLTGLDVVSVGE